MKILITGTSGFIANRFFLWMQKNQPNVLVYGFDHSNGLDVRNKEKVFEYVKEVDVVFHLAALTHIDTSIKTPEPFIDVNINGALNVLESCTKLNKKLVIVSSSEVYGSMTEQEYSSGQTQGEDFRLQPHSPYAVSKLTQDRMAWTWFFTYGTDVRIVRPFNQFGPGQDNRKFIPKSIVKSINGLPITLHGKGDSTRDWVWVDDTVEGIWKSIELPAGETINLSTGISYTASEIADIILSIGHKFGYDTAGKIATLRIDDRFGHVKHLKGNSEKASNLIGWNPNINIEELIERLWHFYIGNGDSFYFGGEKRIIC